MKVLITSGATREPIDEVRYITNFSTGKTGATLANFFAQERYDVTYLYSKGAMLPGNTCDLVEYITFDDLNQTLSDLLSNKSYDVIIHACAVSDFRISEILKDNKNCSSINEKKISSEDDLIIKLKRNPKIIASMQAYSKNKNVCIIGFKLTNTDNESLRLDKIKNVAKHPGVRYVVHNDMGDIKNHQRIFRIYKDTVMMAKALNEKELCDELNKLIKKDVI